MAQPNAAHPEGVAETETALPVAAARFVRGDAQLKSEKYLSLVAPVAPGVRRCSTATRLPLILSPARWRSRAFGCSTKPIA